MRFDPYDYDIQNDPYPAYAWLRTNDPVHHNDVEDFWVLTRYADVERAFRDDQTFSNAMGVTIDRSSWGKHAKNLMSIIALDAPQHMRLRGLVAKAFTPRRVRESEPRITELAHGLLEPAIATGTFDWIRDFAARFPMDVISDLMGVPAADRDEVRRLADVLVHREDGVRDVPPAGVAAALELITYYEKLLDRKRREPGDDLTSALLVADVDGERLDQAEILAFLFLMVVAGNETTAKLLGNALFHAFNHPFEQRRMYADAAMVSPWIEETLRYDTSTQMLARHVTQDVEFGDRVIPADSKALLMIGSANRDEAVFSDGDVYDLGRDTSRTLSFGIGRHYCLGANLARLEAQIALAYVQNRTSWFEVDIERAERVHSINVRGFSSLPVEMASR